MSEDIEPKQTSYKDMMKLSENMQDIFLKKDDMLEVELQDRGNRYVLYVHINGTTVSRFNVPELISFVLDSK